MVNLREIRRNMGLTGANISEKTGITQQYYSAIETGRRRPSVEVAKRLGAALGFHWPMLFENDGPEENPEMTEEGTE